MSLEEILTSEVEITYELLKGNKITLSQIKKDYYVICKINNERILTILLIFEEKNAFDNCLKFLIMLTYVRLRNFEKAYEYVYYLYKHEKKYQSDYRIYLILLNTLMGNEEIPFRLTDVLVSYSDKRFDSPSFQNKLRTAIFYHDYDKANKIFIKLYKRPLNIPEIINILLKEIKRKTKSFLLESIENNNIQALKEYLDSINCELDTNKNKLTLFNILCDELDGITLKEPKEMPKENTLSDAVKARDLDAAVKCGNDDIINAFVRKIKELDQENIEFNYRGILSPYFYTTIESIYACIMNHEFAAARIEIENYLNATDNEVFEHYINGLLESLESDIDTLLEDDLTLRIASIYDTLIRITLTRTKRDEEALLNKCTGEQLNIKPYSKVHTMDVEYNYEFDDIDELTQSVIDGDIDYMSYYTKEDITVDDLLRLCIIAREFYRIGSLDTGDNILTSTTQLMKKHKIKSSEVLFFSKAIYNQREKLVGRVTPSFIEEVKTLIRD